MLRSIDTSVVGLPRDPRPVVVIGGGIGGLVSALLLAVRGVPVLVLEKSAVLGGKLREVTVGGRAIDSGPTVFTMRWVFETIFGAAGTSVDAQLRLKRAEILARHSWPDGSTFDLHADKAASADAVGRLAGAQEARGYLAFCQRTEEVFRSLNEPFMENPTPNPMGLAREAGLSGLVALARIKPFTALSKVIEAYFRDPRLRQLFGRYATYCGSSPYEAPGPLMLIAHVEQTGVWLVDGGMIRIVAALEGLARKHGARFAVDSNAEAIIVKDGAASAVRLASGEIVEARAVIFNGDPAALFSGLLGAEAQKALPAWKPRDRSLSALTWSRVATVRGFPLSRHTVFFGGDYRREFDDILRRRDLPGDPTIYVCAQDRDATAADESIAGEERLMMLVNAPARADEKPLSEAEITACEARVTKRLAGAGLELSAPPNQSRTTTPSDFAAMFPGSGGALYGRASHGWAASFQRPGARTPISGLYLAGGAVHPGPGIPMAALSGRFAAQAVLRDLASTTSFLATATPGGMSTRSATKDTMH